MKCDILIIGAGIAGASTAAELASFANVLIIEAEDQPGYHTTGRSAAFYAESYGGPAIQPLTTASKDFYFKPPRSFSEGPLVSPRGCLHLFGPQRQEKAQKIAKLMAGTLPRTSILDKDDVLDRLPILRPEKIAGAIDDPECRDLDVARIHQAYLAKVKRQGGRVLCNAALKSAKQTRGSWLVETARGSIEADIIINAAGAWADDVARCVGATPIGFTALRRTIIVFQPQTVEICNRWPLALDLDEKYYFKPETGRILASPADETPLMPCDVQPDELDIAQTVDRIQKVSILDVPRIENRWAGLRTFSPDRVPVFGADPAVRNFFWCAGQGGYGIQTAPAAAKLTASLVLSHPIPEELAKHGVKPTLYSPNRF